MEQITLDFIPKNILPVLHVSRKDYLRKVKVKFVENGEEVSGILGTGARIKYRRPDGYASKYGLVMSGSGNTKTFDIPYEITMVKGDVYCKIERKTTSYPAAGDWVCFGAFIIRVEDF